MADNEISGTENANGVPQLKPCPFCGGKARLEWMDGDELDLCWVECGRCGASTVFCGQPKLAIDAWNTRAERTCHAEYHDCGDGVGGWYCSECGDLMDAGEFTNCYYCPNCGAKVVSE